jgi:transcriptional regulator with XRE-family HTH domain
MPPSLFTEAYQCLIQSMVAARQSAGMRQLDLAKKLGKPQSFISKMETGERRIDVIEFLVIARAMGTDPLQLISEVIAAMPSDTAI